MSVIKSAALVATTLTDITAGGLGANEAGTYLLNLVNRSETASAKVRVAITTGGAVADKDYLEFGAATEPGGVLSRWPLPLGVGAKVFVWAETATISAVLAGRSI